MGLSKTKNDFTTQKGKSYEILYSNQDELLRMGAYTKYKIQNFTNPKKTITTFLNEK